MIVNNVTSEELFVLAKSIVQHVTKRNREINRIRRYADNAVDMTDEARIAIHNVASGMTDNCIADVKNMLVEGKPIYRGR